MNNLDISKLSNKEKIKLLEQEDCSLDIIEGALKDKSDDIRYNAAKHSNLSKERLLELVSYKDYSIILGVIRNNNSDEEILEILLKDKNPYIRYNAAQNYNLSKKILLKLAKSNDAYIRCGVSTNNRVL